MNVAGYRWTTPLVEMNGIQLSEWHPDSLTYSSLRPALWQTEHLLNVLKTGILQSNTSPWSFETIKPERAIHCASNPLWPSSRDGFVSKGRIVEDYVSRWDEPCLEPLKRQLVRKARQDKRRETLLLPARFARRLARRLINIIRIEH